MHSSGQRKKNHCSFIFLSRPNRSNFAPPRAETTPQCSSSTPTCFRYLKHSKNPLGKILLLVVLQYFCWCDLDWAEVQVRKRLCGLRLQENKLRLILQKKNEEEKLWESIHPNSSEWFYPEGWANFGWVKNSAFSLSGTSQERWTEAEWIELVRFQQHLAVKTLTRYCVYDLYTAYNLT